MRTSIQAEIVDYLDYNAEIGELRWLVTPRNGTPAGVIAGGIDAKGYRIIKFKRKSYKAHRIAWLLHYGVWPTDDLDHINGVKDDNRINNLRIAGHAENLKNQGIYKNNKSGIPGVHWHNRDQKWHVQIGGTLGRKFIGCYLDLVSAVIARMKAEKEHGYHINHGRKP